MARDDLIQIRQGTAAQWASANPVLAVGEPGLATDTGVEKIGDGVKTWSQLPTRLSGTYALKRMPTIALIGDSIANQDADYGVTLANQYWFNSKGFMAWANVLLRQRFTRGQVGTTGTVGVSNNLGSFGNSGKQAADLIVDGSLAAAAASSYDIFVENAGTNDIGAGRTPAQVAADKATMWKTLTTTGKTVVACTILPRNNGESATATIHQNLRDANRLIRTAARSTPGVVLCDWYACMLDPATSLARAAFLADGIHPNIVGASRMGAVLAQTLSGLVPAWDGDLALDNADTKDVLTNSLLTGTSGTLSGAQLSGSVATSCTAYQIGTPTSVVASKVARTDLGAGEWQQFIVTTSAPNTDGVQIQQQNTNVGTDWNIGDTVYLTAEFETDAAGWDGRMVLAELQGFNGTFQAAGLRAGSGERTSLTVPLYRPASGVIATPLAVITAGTTRLQANLYFYGGGTIRWGRIQVVKV